MLENVPGARFPRDPARPQAGESPLEHHKSTLILIESGYFYYSPKPQYFWAFSRFKADLGYSRDRPFLRLCSFQMLLPKSGFVGILGSSLDLSRVWIIRLSLRILLRSLLPHRWQEYPAR